MDQPLTDRRLAVILAAGVAGYSRLMEADEEGTLAPLKAHRRAIDPKVREHRGRLLKLTDDGVNIAARLEGLAEPGGIWISRGVRDPVSERLGFTFEDIGEQALKNIATPVQAYRVRLPRAIVEQVLSIG
jgi:class 3 adenylate cyclase